MAAPRSIVWTVFLCAATVAPAALADRVVTVDGRVLTPNKAREEGAGYKLVWDAGEIVLADKALVKAVEIEGDMSDYVPKDEKEKEYLEKGFVLYRGRWMSKPAYENELKREFEKSQALTEEMAKHSDFRNAWEEESKHFIVRTNTSPVLLEYYMNLLETYYDLMDDRFGIKLSPAMRRTKMVVNIYKNRAEFHDLNAAGLGGGVAGYFSPSTLDLNFYHDYAEPAVSDWVCLHEGTHLLTHLIDPDYIAQIWVNEAVADYFGSADIARDKRDRLEITPGKLQTDRVLTVQQAIREGNDIKLEDLFLITRDEFQAFEYAHAWSFVYFLNESKKYRKGFDKFFKDLYTLKKGIAYELVNYASQSGRGKRVAPEEIRRVLLDSLKEQDTEKLEAEWKDFIREVAIDGPEARFKRGYRAVILGQMYSSDREKFAANRTMAQEDLDFAIAEGVGGARAYYARAQLLQISNKPADAMDDIDKAIALDPLNARYRYEMAQALARGSLDDVTAEKNPEVGPFLGLAAALDPENQEYERQYEHYLGK